MSEENSKPNNGEIRIVLPKPEDMVYDIPENMHVWESDKDISEEFKETSKILHSLIIYIASRLNSDPELKNNIAKRCLVLQALIRELLQCTFIDSLHRLGILSMLEHDIYSHCKDMQKTPLIIEAAKNFKDGHREGYIT